MGFYRPWVDFTKISSSITVSTTGSDATGNGSYTAPFATINKALSKIQESMKHQEYIYILAGTYTENINISKLGGATAIRLRGEAPTIVHAAQVVKAGSCTARVIAKVPAAEGGPADWTPSEHIGRFAYFTSGTGYTSNPLGYSYDPNAHVIIDNDATTLTVQYMGFTPTATDKVACTVDDGTDFVTLALHGFVNTDQVSFRAVVMPTNLVAETTYYVVNSTPGTFQVALTSGGAPIDIGSTGTDVYVGKVVAGSNFRICENSVNIVGSLTSTPDIPTTVFWSQYINWKNSAAGIFSIYSGNCYAGACVFENTNAGTSAGYGVYCGPSSLYNFPPLGTMNFANCYFKGKFDDALELNKSQYVMVNGCYFNGVDKSDSTNAIKLVSCPDANMANTRIKNYERAVSINYSQFQCIIGNGNIIDTVDYDFYSEGQSYMSIYSPTFESIANVTYGSLSKDYSRIDKISTLGNGYAADYVNDATSKIYYNDVKNLVGRYTPEIWRTASISSGAGTTNLFIVPPGRTCLVHGALVRMTADAAHVGDLTAGIGVAAGEDDIFASTVLAGLTTTNVYQYIPAGTAVTVAAGSTIKLGIDTSHTGGSSTLEVQLFYTLI